MLKPTRWVRALLGGLGTAVLVVIGLTALAAPAAGTPVPASAGLTAGAGSPAVGDPVEGELQPCCLRIADPIATPEPTVGSTEAPNPGPPGSADGDPGDWSGSNWVWLFGIFVLIVIVALFTYAVRRTRRRP